MKLLYYDCFMGISGDMNLGALIDLGVDKEYLLNELKKLNLQGYHIEINKGMKNGINGTQVKVEIESNPPHAKSVMMDSHHQHEPQRGMKEISQIIENSTLNDNIKSKSMAMFEHIAQAEAKIHNKPIEEIHFHEVGALDSIIDIVGAAICLDYLNPDKIMASSIELGGGMVKCAHGLFPVPAPATAEILKGKPVKTGAVQFETTTPTGAAILVTYVDEFNDTNHFVIEKTGYGHGYKEAEVPNLLRVFWTHDDETNYSKHYQTMIETNIDDMSGECYEAVFEKLFEAGSRDVFLTPIIMKKSRPAVTLSVLCDNENSNIITDLIFRHTTSIGVRTYKVLKEILERNIQTIKTPYGMVRIKLSGRKGHFSKAKPEYEDCFRISKESNKPLTMILAEIQQLANKLLESSEETYNI